MIDVLIYQRDPKGIEELICAAILTIGIFLALTIVALTTKFNLPFYFHVFYSLSIILLMSIVLLFIYPHQKSAIFILSICILVASLYIVYDIQIISKPETYGFNLDDFISASMITLYRFHLFIH